MHNLLLAVAMFMAFLGANSYIYGQELRAICWSEHMNGVPCKVREEDSSIYWNGKWHTNYFISDTFTTDNGQLYLLVLELK